MTDAQNAELQVIELANPLLEELDEIEQLPWPREAKDNLKELVRAIYGRGTVVGFLYGYEMAMRDCHLPEREAETPHIPCDDGGPDEEALAQRYEPEHHRKHHHPVKAVERVVRGLWWELAR